jgi:hypothetical protein
MSFARAYESQVEESSSLARAALHEKMKVVPEGQERVETKSTVERRRCEGYLCARGGVVAERCRSESRKEEKRESFKGQVVPNRAQQQQSSLRVNPWNPIAH